MRPAPCCCPSRPACSLTVMRPSMTAPFLASHRMSWSLTDSTSRYSDALSLPHTRYLRGSQQEPGHSSATTCRQHGTMITATGLPCAAGGLLGTQALWRCPQLEACYMPRHAAASDNSSAACGLSWQETTSVFHTCRCRWCLRSNHTGSRRNRHSSTKASAAIQYCTSGGHRHHAAVHLRPPGQLAELTCQTRVQYPSNLQACW